MIKCVIDSYDEDAGAKSNDATKTIPTNFNEKSIAGKTTGTIKLV